MSAWDRTGLSGILGQAEAVGFLERSLASGRVAHAYLFQGPEGVGKRTTALLFARTLLCEDPEALGCGVCHACRRVAAGTHPDLLALLSPEEAESEPFKIRPWGIPVGASTAAEGGSGARERERRLRREIGIDQVRAAQRMLSFLPHEGKRKVLIVEGAEQISRPAANAFLKTLEEPPGEAVILLLSVQPASLLPTIVSRCLTVRFRPLADTVVAQILAALAAMPPEQAARLAPLAEGRVGLALRLAEEEALEREAWFAAILDGLPRWSLPQTLREAERLSQDPQALDAFLGWLARQARWSLEAFHGTAPGAGPLPEGAQGVGRGFTSPDQVDRCVRALNAVEWALKKHGGRRLAGEALCLRLREIFGGHLP
ncbi:MAG: DNA polymerase III subunit delta' [Nitrospirae bacterium]|nr:DNA polymerase III subunit delta' [Nitrospirota bacterium]